MDDVATCGCEGCTGRKTVSGWRCDESPSAPTTTEWPQCVLTHEQYRRFLVAEPQAFEFSWPSSCGHWVYGIPVVTSTPCDPDPPVATEPKPRPTLGEQWIRDWGRIPVGSAR